MIIPNFFSYLFIQINFYQLAKCKNLNNKNFYYEYS